MIVKLLEDVPTFLLEIKLHFLPQLEMLYKFLKLLQITQIILLCNINIQFNQLRVDLKKTKSQASHSALLISAIDKLAQRPPIEK